ncbi:U-box domain-containing protein 15-like [Canna indica]|uniref:RING-type E3 ubiquitin transferase n=1 Tax=Canna indica TaxID=4628 RepID=A0AAQ3QPY0_9LILI|nr:U-box domain-containing protein 15-like [Canna indica]
MEEKTVAAAVVVESEEAVTRSEHNVDDLIGDMLEIINSVREFGEFLRTQRKEAFNLVQRVKMMVSLLEEMRESEDAIPGEAYACFCSVFKALSAAKKLLRCCHDGSKICLALEGEAIMGRFRMVYDKLSQALDGMPYDQLGVSDEVKEQVELMNVQLKRAKRRIDTQDMELAMDLMVVLSKRDDRDTDGAVLERLAKKFELQTLPDLEQKQGPSKKLVKKKAAKMRKALSR